MMVSGSGQSLPVLEGPRSYEELGVVIPTEHCLEPAETHVSVLTYQGLWNLEHTKSSWTELVDLLAATSDFFDVKWT